MKNADIPVYINRFFMLTTLVLYLTVFWGLLAQIFLGAFQVLTGLFLLFFLNRIPEKIKKHLMYYWISVLIYGAFYLINRFESFEDYWVLSIILVPMGIAGYFTYILESIKKQGYEN